MDGDNTNEFKRDATAANDQIWGGPFPQGGLFAIADGTVRLILYGTNLSPFLKADRFGGQFDAARSTFTYTVTKEAEQQIVIDVTAKTVTRK